MTYFDAPQKWIIVYGFTASTLTICMVVIFVGHRHDAGRSYLEQCCTVIHETLEALERRV
jgi:hypothetical protein